MSLFSQVAPSIAETLNGVVEEKASTEVSQEKGVMSTDTPPKEEESFAVKYAMDIVGREPRVLEPVPKKSKTYKVELPEVSPLEIQAYLDSIEVEQGPITPPTTMGEMAGATASDVATERDEADITQSRTKSANVYQIKKGDNLSKIARANNTTVAAILELNDIENPDIIVEGERLVMPDPVSPTANLETAGVMSRPEPVAEEATEEEPVVEEASTNDGLMSTTLDTKGSDPSTVTLTTGKYLRDIGLVADDGSDVLPISGAIEGTDFKNREDAIANINSAIENAYSSPITAQAIKTTIDHESGTRLIEGTNYTRNGAISMLGGGNADRIARIEALFGDRNRLPQAEQVELFNIAYGGRMGNAANEGYKYRGRGLIQITGKNNYRAVSRALGLGDALVDNPDLLMENPSLMLAATDAYLTQVRTMDRDDVLTANTLKDLIGHSGSKPAGFNGTGTAYAGMQRWNEVVTALEEAGKQEEADEARLNNEFTAQQTVGTYVDGDIGPNSENAMRSWLSDNDINIPEGASGMDLVRLVNGNA